MYIRGFGWDSRNRDHIAKHGVGAAEVEEAILLSRPLYRKSREGKYAAYAVTEDGRHLLIVFAVKGRGWIRVVSARDMSGKERHYYRKRRGG